MGWWWREVQELVDIGEVTTRLRLEEQWHNGVMVMYCATSLVREWWTERRLPEWSTEGEWLRGHAGVRRAATCSLLGILEGWEGVMRSQITSEHAVARFGLLHPEKIHPLQVWAGAALSRWWVAKVYLSMMPGAEVWARPHVANEEHREFRLNSYFSADSISISIS